MNICKKIIRMAKEPKYRIQVLSERGFYKWMSDEKYLKKLFLIKIGYPLDLKNPQTFNEKLQWLKINNRLPEHTIMVDKLQVKDYVAKKIGSDYIIPTIGVWEKFDDIEFDSLPDKFVLKCTHDSGGVVVCKDKKLFNKKESKKIISKSLKRNYYWSGREWPYKNVKPKVIAEKYIEDCENDALMDYKFFCFNGKPQIMYMSRDESRTPYTDFYDMDFNHLPIRMKDPNSKNENQKPALFEQMKMFAEILSEGHAHIRVDFYCVNNHIYFGELTFFHNSGFSKISPKEWDYKLGELINLDLVKKNESK